MPVRPETEHLFTYGTLLDKEIQRILLGREYPPRPARLTGWTLHASADGYLFIKADPAGTVDGGIIAVDQAVLMITDQWEEVPRYLREKLTVALANGTSVEAWAYTRRDGDGTAYRGKKTSLLDRQALLAQAALFGKSSR